MILGILIKNLGNFNDTNNFKYIEQISIMMVVVISMIVVILINLA